MTVPPDSPSVSSLYSASQLQLIKSGRVSNAEQQRHAGTTCNACGLSPIVGPRHKQVLYIHAEQRGDDHVLAANPQPSTLLSCNQNPPIYAA